MDVKIYSSESKPRFHQKRKKAKILTPDYVRKLNKEISDRIISSQAQSEIAVKNLTKKLFR